jgi:hypothetical protein
VLTRQIQSTRHKHGVKSCVAIDNYPFYAKLKFEVKPLSDYSIFNDRNARIVVAFQAEATIQ